MSVRLGLLLPSRLLTVVLHPVCRLLVGFYQLLGQMDNVLSLEFPQPVPTLVEFISWMFLDVKRFIKLE